MEIEDIKPGDTVLLKNGDSRFGGVVWRPPSFPDSLIAGDTTIFMGGQWIVRREHIVEIRPGPNRHD